MSMTPVCSRTGLKTAGKMLEQKKPHLCYAYSNKMKAVRELASISHSMQSNKNNQAYKMKIFCWGTSECLSKK